MRLFPTLVCIAPFACDSVCICPRFCLSIHPPWSQVSRFQPPLATVEPAPFTPNPTGGTTNPPLGAWRPPQKVNTYGHPLAWLWTSNANTLFASAQTSALRQEHQPAHSALSNPTHP